MKRYIREFNPALIVMGIILSGILNLSCLGENPPFSPFGSEVMFLDPPDDIVILLNNIEPIEVSAEILSPDGEPLNDVRIIWSLSFAGENSFLLDTDGDGVPDSRLLQLVDPTECPGGCLNQPLPTWFGFGAFKDSPYETLTNNRGQSTMVILITNPAPFGIAIDPASLEVSTGSGDVDVAEFTVNVP